MAAFLWATWLLLKVATADNFLQRIKKKYIEQISYHGWCPGTHCEILWLHACPGVKPRKDSHRAAKNYITQQIWRLHRNLRRSAKQNMLWQTALPAASRKKLHGGALLITLIVLSRFNNKDETNNLYLCICVLDIQWHHLVTEETHWAGFSWRRRHLNLGVYLKVSVSPVDHKTITLNGNPVSTLNGAERFC